MSDKRILHLNLKGKWYDKIKSGEKTHELRLVKDHWTKRLVGREYDEVHLKRGFPKKGDAELTLKRAFGGVTMKTMIHEEFGPEPVQLYSIDVSKKLKK